MPAGGAWSEISQTRPRMQTPGSEIALEVEGLAPGIGRHRHLHPQAVACGGVHGADMVDVAAGGDRAQGHGLASPGQVDRFGVDLAAGGDFLAVGIGVLVSQKFPYSRTTSICEYIIGVV